MAFSSSGMLAAPSGTQKSAKVIGGMENDSRFGVLGVNASGLDGERVELGRFGLAEVQKHGIIPPPPPQPRTPKIFRKWLKLHARVRATLQLLVVGV